MIHLPESRAVFVHNPKAAGTSITAALEAAVPAAHKFWGRAYVPRLDMVRDLAHIPACEMRDFLPGRPRVDFTFGVVRDPYARFVSALKHFHAHGGYQMRMTPDTFIDRYLNHTTLRSDWRFIHFCPQYRFFHRGERCLVDLVGRFEDLPPFIDEVSDRLGLLLTLPDDNASVTDDIALGDAAVAAINHFYARDFALFGYEPRSTPTGVTPLGTRILYADFDSLWPEERGLDTTELLRV